MCMALVDGPTRMTDLENNRWVYSTLTPPDQSGQEHDLYDPALSEDSVWLRSSTWSITYVDGTSASGNVYMDEVDVGGTIVVSQTLGVALQVSPKLQEDPADGILGLASSALNTSRSGLTFAGSQYLIIKTDTPTPQSTFLQNAIDQGVIDEPVFTVDLKKGAAGSYDFGFIDATKYIEPITWVP
jgi:hypothetical protein